MSFSKQDMEGKTVIITGGSRGIGLGITETFLNAGATVVIAYRSNDEAANNAAKQLNDNENSLLLVKANIAIAEDRENLVKKTVKHFGRIDALVNNAGIVIPSNIFEESEDDFDKVIATNLKGPALLAQAVAKQMISQNMAGSIVNISSISAKIPNATMAYCASKAGIEMITKNLAYALAEHDIRVNTVMPGTIRSDMNRYYWKDNPDKWQAHVEQIPLKRGGEPSELAEAVLFLASDKASYITGAELFVDGGGLLKPIW